MIPPTTIVACTLACLTLLAFHSRAVGGEATTTYQDIEATLGQVPTMFKVFPEVGIAGAWSEFRSIQLNPNTALDAKTKELLGLAAASQIPCVYCIYFHTAAAKANGATDAEIRGAVAMAAIVRHWSTVLNGSQVDFAAFKAETNAMLARAAAKAADQSQQPLRLERVPALRLDAEVREISPWRSGAPAAGFISPA